MSITRRFFVAKTKRFDVGSIVISKGKEANKADALFNELATKYYFKASMDFVVKKGDILGFETKKSRIAALEKCKEEGKLDEDFCDQLIERANKIPDFVFANMVQVKKDQ